jgi:GcrA cell cycle regulator
MADRFDWNEKRIDRLRELWIEGLPASAIAKDLGDVSRNAVLGKAHRIGLPLMYPRKDKQCRRTMALPKAPRTKARKQATNQASGFARRKEKPAHVHKRFPTPEDLKPTPLPVDVVPDQIVALVDLKPHHCRWPFGDPLTDAFGFCGRDKADGSSYCPAHRARSASALRTSRADPVQALIKSLRRAVA